MANEWAGVIHANMPKYQRGLENLVMRNRILFALLKQRGRIKYNESSYTCILSVRFSQQDVEPYEDGTLVTFTRHDPARQLEVDWRGYITKDVMTKKEKLMNSGNTAIYKRYDRIAGDLKETLTDTFGSEIFVDGYAANNDSRLIGMESFMGTAGVVLQTDKVAIPSDTYGGLNTNLADQGGSWSPAGASPPNSTLGTSWPNGTGTAEYDYLAPKLLNSDHDWGSGTEGWAANGDFILRRAISWLRLTSGLSGRPDLALMPGDLLADFKDKMSKNQRIVVPHRRAEDLGFDDSLNFEGIILHDDFECPAETVYVMNVDKMDLRSLDSNLFFSEGPDYSIDNLSWRWLCGFFGNMTFSPKFFAKIAKFT